MDIKAFKSELFTAASGYGFTDYELYYAKGASFLVRIFKGEISEYKNASPAGVTFRGTFNGKVGYAFTEKIESCVITELIENAAANAGILEAAEIERLYGGDSEYPECDSYNKALDDFTVEQKIKLAMEMEKYAYTLDSRIKSIDYCQLSSSASEMYIANSKGLELSHNANGASAFISVRVEEDGKVKLGGEFWMGNDLNNLNPHELAQKATHEAISYLGAKSAPTGGYPVVFDNMAANSLFRTFSSIFFAEKVQKGFSLLKGRIGEKIASDIVTVRDDGVCQYNFGSVPFDSEGVAVKNKAVIEKGVLCTYLYNLKTAEKDGVASTGNGFKASYKSPVDTACTNFYLEPSDISRDDMIHGINKGILITDLAGLHSGTNTVSGDFSCSADGYMIEDGKISRPVEQITVAGNFFELLKDITGVACDLRFDSTSPRAYGMPSILVKELKISGE